MRDYYKEIDDSLEKFENYTPYKIYDIDWICGRIDWCWKWKKISAEQKDELCERAIKVMEDYT